jgi:hypothetical protein
LVRKFSSAAAAGSARGLAASSAGGAAAGDAPEADAPPSEDEGGGGFRGRSAPTRLDKTAGMHRFTWDLRYPGPWQSNARPEGPNGPAAVPGKYSVRLAADSWTSTQPLIVIEDPRVIRDGVATADLREQFEHNMRVRDLVSDVNRTVASVRANQAAMRTSGTSADALAKLNELAAHLITPSIRYSKPELQTHITYLYSLTTATDQKIGRDAIDRYVVLRKELDQRMAELGKILGK